MGLKRDPAPRIPDAPARGVSPPAPPPAPPRVFLPTAVDRRDIGTWGSKSIFDLLITKRQLDRFKKSKEVEVAAEQQAKNIAQQNAARVRIREVCCK